MSRYGKKVRDETKTNNVSCGLTINVNKSYEPVKITVI